MRHLPWKQYLTDSFSSTCRFSLNVPSSIQHLQRHLSSSSSSAQPVAENEPSVTSATESKSPAVVVVKKKKKKKKSKEPPVYAGPRDGAKKDTSLAMPDAYYPQYVEAAWQDWWEATGIFTTSKCSQSDPRSADTRETQKRKYSIVLPPPNVTGNLHIGHALTASVQDALCRWRRMCGDEVTWVPGFDHAGIATQSVVEKKLWAEEGKTREDVGRDEFVERVKAWKDQKASTIENQLRRLGASLDWNRRVFTLDPALSSAVDEAFIRLYDQGLIYRSLGLVNWCCHLQSTISDVEVDSVAVEGRTELAIPGYDDKVTFGVMDSLAYRLDGVGSEEIVVSTTRLETMLGDVAVAVHPEDDRYKSFVGRRLKHPFRNCSIPVIADSSVDRAFGTGAVKITPAHDKRDFELARRHTGLSSPITMLDESGRVTKCFDDFAGDPRFVARRRVREALSSLGLFRGSRDHAMTLPVCSRSGDVVEPMLKQQWFLDCSHMSAKAMEVANDGQLEFVPSFHAKVWNHFLAQQRDWCISRQLWWGHRIPAYRVSSTAAAASMAATTTTSAQEEELWVAAKTEEEAREKAARRVGVDSSTLTLRRDPDVLDTWFSSALFPFSALGWPAESTSDRQSAWRDQEGLFPLSLMETGHDILFFWVARMVMLGLQLTNTLPFKKVYLHGMIRDAHGRKMSKSLGNVVDPLDVMTGKDLDALAKQLEDAGLSPAELEIARDGQRKSFPEGIPECGTDALRFALLSCDIQSVDVSMDILNIRHQRHFCNKIWQASRFFFHHLNARDFTYINVDDDGNSRLSEEDLNILQNYQSMVNDCHEGLELFEFRFATGAIHKFIWFQLCDVYLEHSKPFLNNLDCSERDVKMSVILFCLEGTMRALHPFMPFLTEELWQRLKPLQSDGKEINTICLANYPERNSNSLSMDDDVQQVI